MENKNYVRVTGNIITITELDKIVIVKIATSGDNSHVSYPDFGLRKDLATGLKKGDRVTIEGYMHSLIGKKDGKYKREMVGTSIVKANRMLASYVDGLPEEGGFGNDENIVVFVGEVHNIYPVQAVTLINVAIPQVRNGKETGYKDYCQMTCFKRQADFANTLKVGDTVALAGCVQTKPEKDGHRVLQSVLCRDIEKIEE